ncbi:putative membrane protein [Chitinophaga costaii]|uniref:Putative membrane protein n=1 Tax=Chitinophaga costaii TaxID=1335309 RepID=A0A1C4FCE7_9BACT|nr:DUF4142 domain-containing protein [Chitinophaga costaii]PUZ20690.1 DUF4142 domain-containing protein [Chitinophaga costaii]SCC53570.1 putative membrane protein [Chitinophaga costaii]
MKRISLFALILSSAWALSSCGDGHSTTTKDSTGTEVTDSKAVADSTNKETKPVDKESADFSVKAADIGFTEVAMGKLAQDKASQQRVKDFGNLLITDHTKAGDELKAIADRKGITLPTAFSPEHQSAMEKLNDKKGLDWDKAFIDHMIDGHKSAIDDFDKASKNLEDADIKAFATNTLPTLKAHLDSAEAIKDYLKNVKTHK